MAFYRAISFIFGKIFFSSYFAFLLPSNLHRTQAKHTVSHSNLLQRILWRLLTNLSGVQTNTFLLLLSQVQSHVGPSFLKLTPSHLSCSLPVTLVQIRPNCSFCGLVCCLQCLLLNETSLQQSTKQFKFECLQTRWKLNPEKAEFMLIGNTYHLKEIDSRLPVGIL